MKFVVDIFVLFVVFFTAATHIFEDEKIGAQVATFLTLLGALALFISHLIFI